MHRGNCRRNKKGIGSPNAIAVYGLVEVNAAVADVIRREYKAGTDFVLDANIHLDAVRGLVVWVEHASFCI